jgi:hypothetical protein
MVGKAAHPDLSPRFSPSEVFHRNQDAMDIDTHYGDDAFNQYAAGRVIQVFLCASEMNRAEALTAA